ALSRVSSHEGGCSLRSHNHPHVVRSSNLRRNHIRGLCAAILVYEWRLRNEDRGHARVRWVGVPVPVSQPKCWVADELAQDAFVHMQVAAMPGHEPPTAMDLNIAGVIATGAVEAMDVGLLHPAAR